MLGLDLYTLFIFLLIFIKIPFCLCLQLKNKFMKKLPRDAEASNVLVGEVDFLDSPFVAFVRLQQAVMLGALTEVPVPTRYDPLLSHKIKAKVNVKMFS